MTPGDFPSLQEGMENLDTDDYVGWRLPYVSECEPITNHTPLTDIGSEEEDAEDYSFPLTLRNPQKAAPGSLTAASPNGGI